MNRLCPRHGLVTTLGTRCPRSDCGLPLLRLDGRTDQPQAWAWESVSSWVVVRLDEAEAIAAELREQQGLDLTVEQVGAVLKAHRARAA